MASSSLDASVHDDPQVEFVNFLGRQDIRRLNYEDKEFYRPGDIKDWMRQSPKTRVGSARSNAARLLYKVYHEHDWGLSFQPTTEHQIISQHLLVFAILAHPTLDCGHMIHVFRKHIRDGNLDILDLSRIYQDITADLSREATSLPERYREDGYRAVTSAFDQLRWAFSPAPLDLYMDQSFPQGSCILPFCYRKPINEKGGTASVQMYGMQEDLVVSENLRQVLQCSRKNHPEFGWCYEIAVKSYKPSWADIHKMESQAFKGMRDQQGVVKYLGEYHLVNSLPGEQIMPTSHIMLEYGELDLDEYLAETYPPILSEEVLTFWEGLFKVAGTIKRLHNLKHVGGDGREQHFKGWHGDIKPDNILRVRGEYMLADFGFTRFEKDTPGDTTTHLLGGTRTYGAPECDTRARGGTLTSHSQAIDTWSFGCVLSAVATWVVLGSQAYENYGKRRELAIQELRQQAKESGISMTLPSCDDAFHDGLNVLPAVTQWHDYLRNSCRRADTITPLVLDLVDRKMLLSQHRDRPTLSQLCTALDDILAIARDKHRRAIASGKLKEMTPKTLEALLKLDDNAPAIAIPASQAGLSGLVPSSNSPSSPTSVPELSKGHQLSPPPSRVRKSDRFNKIVAARTANRQGVIKNSLGKPQVPGSGFDQHVIHESPEQAPLHFKNNSHFSQDQENPCMKPEIRVITDNFVSTITTDSPVVFEGIAQHAQAPSHRPNKPVRPHRSTAVTDSPDPQRQDPMLYNEHSSGDLAAELPTPDTDQYSQPYSPRDRVLASLRPQSSAEAYRHDRVPIQLHDGQGHSRSPGPENVNKQIGLPNFVVQQPDLESTAIFTEYNRLKEEWGDKKGPWHTFMSNRKVPEDHRLKKFIFNRDIIFLVDNAASMEPHWEHVKTTLLALAMKIGTLDEDGLDLIFTLGQAYDKSNVKGWDIPAQFEDAMYKAQPEFASDGKTDMAATLWKVFDSYTDVSKKQTIIVLTDGLWYEGSRIGDNVESAIIEFIEGVRKERKGKKEPRWYTIQFISFGHDAKALKRMTALDDELGTAEDVVDHKPWDSPDVEKLILGSILSDLDNPTTQPSPHREYLRSVSPTPSQSNAAPLDRKKSKRQWFANKLGNDK